MSQQVFHPNVYSDLPQPEHLPVGEYTMTFRVERDDREGHLATHLTRISFDTTE